MYSEVFGHRINLIHVAILVALYDIVHIIYEVYNRFEMLVTYETTDFGCLKDFTFAHCRMVRKRDLITLLINFLFKVLIELSIYTLDFLFCIFLIRGAFKVRFKWFFAFFIPIVRRCKRYG